MAADFDEEMTRRLEASDDVEFNDEKNQSLKRHRVLRREKLDLAALAISFEPTIVPTISFYVESHRRSSGGVELWRDDGNGDGRPIAHRSEQRRVCL